MSRPHTTSLPILDTHVTRGSQVPKYHAPEPQLYHLSVAMPGSVNKHMFLQTQGSEGYYTSETLQTITPGVLANHQGDVVQHLPAQRLRVY